MTNPDAAEKLPRWNLDSIFPGPESDLFIQAMNELKTRLDDLDRFLLEHQVIQPSSASLAAPNSEEAASIVEGYLERMNATMRVFTILRLHVWCIVDTDSSNEAASRQLSVLEAHDVRIQRQTSQFQGWLGKQSKVLPDVFLRSEMAREHSLYLSETAEQSHYLMSDAEESLAAELALSGMNAWSKLHGKIWSQLEIPFERDGTTEKLPMPLVQNLALNDPDGNVRQRAAEAEVTAWAGMCEPLAAALNGVIGAKITLNKRRGRKDGLHAALDRERIDREMLDTLLGSIHDSLPVLHQFLKAKAVLLGKEKLPWWDEFAPVGQVERRFTFQEARTFITAAFDQFSPNMSHLAQRAFAENWIDAEPRPGKQGGAYCNGAPGTDISRILCNFDGSFMEVFGIAHELGHAFHSCCRAEKTYQQRLTPMTLAETASIFCETLVTDRALANAASAGEEMAILNTFLCSNLLLNIVGALTLYGFEKEVYERRERSELSADEFCEISQRHQSGLLGDGVDSAHLHPYIWAGGPHLFFPKISFYNFPYTFGLLFSLGLYAQYQQRGPAFVPDYEALLASTGEATPLDLAAQFGIDLHERNFWQASLGLIEKRIQRFQELCIGQNKYQ